MVIGRDDPGTADYPRAGIRLGGQADYCLVVGNQANGFGVSVSDGANNTVEMNRDDG